MKSLGQGDIKKLKEKLWVCRPVNPDIPGFSNWQSWDFLSKMSTNGAPGFQSPVRTLYRLFYYHKQHKLKILLQKNK